jgi:ubiquinone/menaquinone biosynthesis C-methylase UbiE
MITSMSVADEQRNLGISSSKGSGKTREEIAAAYDSPPWWYDIRGFFILCLSYNSTIGVQLRFFGPHMGNNHLEVACGTGTLLGLLLRWRRWKGLPRSHIVGFDYAESMLAGAIHRFKNHPDIELRHADVTALAFADASFDTANIANAIHCFPNIDAGIKEVFRVLKPGGTLAVNVLTYPQGNSLLARISNRINAWGMKKGILYTPYQAADIRQRLQSVGFQVASELRSGNSLCLLLKKP